jgi:hypothetical protein
MKRAGRGAREALPNMLSFYALCAKKTWKYSIVPLNKMDFSYSVDSIFLAHRFVFEGMIVSYDFTNV